MKLAFLAPEFLPAWGGVGTYSAELIRNLCQDKDMEIHVITPKRGKNYDPFKISSFFNNKIILHNISNANDGFFYNFKFQLGILKNFQRLHKEHSFDLIHAANLVHMPDIYLKFKKPDIPSITTIHTTLKSQSHLNGHLKVKTKKTAVEKLTSLSYLYIKSLERIYIRKTNNFIAVSSWIKDFINKNNKDIRVIHNGVDINKFSPKKKQSNEFGFLDDINKPIVLYSGRLLALKGLNVLINSMKEILKKEDLYFLFAGPGSIKRWDKLLKGIPEKNYRFLGYVDYEKIHSLYSSSDIFVLPSFTESFPLTILEAMASGTPVIASKVGGIPEMIENKKDGILIEPGSPAQLTNSIINLLNNSALRKKISINARKKALNKFDSKIMATKTKKFYKEILNSK